MLDHCAIYMIAKWGLMYEIQCLRGGCTWTAKDRTIRKAENQFVDHDIDWHGREYGNV